MKRRRVVLVALTGMALPGALVAQTASRVLRVGYLSMASPEGDRHWVAAFRDGLRDLGYVEGRNLVLEQRHAFNQTAKVVDLANDLVRRDVSVLVVYGSPAVAAVRELKLPIVMTVHADPLGTGVVKSLARPGGNITGLTDGHADLAPKRLEVLKEIVPSIKRVAAIFNPTTAHAARQWKLVEGAAPRLGLTALPVQVRGTQDMDAAFDAILKHRGDAMFMIPDPSWWVGQHQRIATFAIQHRIPGIGTVREFAERGMLAAYGTNFTELWRRSAAYVDKIFKGAKAGDLPIEQPTRFDLIINLKTAKALGITVPRAVVLRADRVIE